MKSNICKIDKGTKDLAAILRESEKVAVYNELDHKQTLHLRLLCEELDGMLPELVGDFDGTLWFEFEDGVCKINVSIELAEISLQKKEQLIGIAKNKKNAAAMGIVGKIRSAIENIALDEELSNYLALSTGSFQFTTGYSNGLDYPYYWSLEQYKNSVNKEEAVETWDEIEKSVVASVADDVMVGVKGRTANIVITKKFN